MQFFDDNSIAEILTRFSKDQAVLDYVVAPLMITVVYAIVRSIGITVSICLVNPYTLIAAAITILFMYLIIKWNTRVL